jgi:hypothetical protein
MERSTRNGPTAGNRGLPTPVPEIEALTSEPDRAIGFQTNEVCVHETPQLVVGYTEFASEWPVRRIRE